MVLQTTSVKGISDKELLEACCRGDRDLAKWDDVRTFFISLREDMFIPAPPLTRCKFLVDRGRLDGICS